MTAREELPSPEPPPVGSVWKHEGDEDCLMPRTVVELDLHDDDIRYPSVRFLVNNRAHWMALHRWHRWASRAVRVDKEAASERREGE